MNHIAKELMHSYVLNMLNEQAREQLEDHLLLCDECLHEYAEAIAAYEHILPDLPDDVPIATHVTMLQSRTKSSSSLFNRSFTHYVIAATVTLMLMSTGVFQSLTGLASTIDEVNKDTASLTEHIMDRTLQWFDHSNEQQKEGETQ